ncbi:MAG: riboflavin synthase subunit alpha [Hahellaceae bacterium]|nr:riboflavin synthase subunit alpha [Hahellaceae bacterium]
MFTGIVQGKAKIISVSEKPGLWQLKIQFPDLALNNIKQGASIAINGTCLTVVSFDQLTCCFDVMQETLRLTNLSTLKPGSLVNFERAAKIGDEIGGHLMSGHIHTQAQIDQIIRDSHNCTLWLATSSEWLKYIFPKGFAGLNGCSLTIGEVKPSRFSVHLIPETLAMTTFGEIRQGEWVNLEIDPQTQAIVDTIERMQLNKS